VPVVDQSRTASEEDHSTLAQGPEKAVIVWSPAMGERPLTRTVRGKCQSEWRRHE
jgi:hypothetical protein